MRDEYINSIRHGLNDETKQDDLKGCLAGAGIYQERTPGNYMIRARLAAGLATPAQLRAAAGLSSRHGDGVLHFTTRQDIQIHAVPLDQILDVVEGLGEAGLSTRGGGGNSVRNISSTIPGVCPNEVFDTTPYALALTRYMLSNEASFSLPRKFKIAFSGCPDDCALASVADLGFFAQIRNRTRGFSVFAAGGMGRNPRPALLLEEFVDPDQVFQIADAVRNLFDHYGDRTNRHRARLRYVVERVGEDEFKKLYRHERSNLAAASASAAAPELHESAQQAGSPIVVRLPLGDITAQNLNKLAELAEQHGVPAVRATQCQNLILPAVPDHKRDALLRALESGNPSPQAMGSPKIIACTGAGVCRIGIANTRDLAAEIARAFDRHGLSFSQEAPAIRISGCPNSCGGHHAAAIGFEGGIRKVGGSTTSVYTLFVGGRPSSQGARLAEKIATVPAHRVPEILVSAFTNGGIDLQRLCALARQHEVPNETDQ